MISAVEAFVPRAKFVLHQKLQWFPGHMHKGIKDIGRTLKQIDCVLEVHDARIGRNLNLLSRITILKPVVLLLNKSDLISVEDKPKIESKLLTTMAANNVPIQHVFFMDSLSANASAGGYDSKLLSTIIDSIEAFKQTANTNNLRFFDDTEQSYSLMVMGIPNVGKSTIINRLRNVYLNKAGRATTTGPVAGVTRSVMERIKICDHPQKIYLFDTPGILEPSFNQHDDKIETLMRCALCGNISEQVVTPELISDYLLYWLNKNHNHKYVDFFAMPGPSNDISEVLTYGAIHLNAFIKVRSIDTGQPQLKPNFNLVAEKFVKAFRKGQFGPILLDKDLL